MNVVIDNRLQEDEGCLELLGVMGLEVPSIHTSYIDCRLDDLDYELDELIARVYAKCIDRKADLFIGLDGIASKMRELKINAVSLNIGEI